MENKEKIKGQIDSYYQSWFEINNIYEVWAKKHGVKDTTLFVLYIINNTKPFCTQNEIGNKLFLQKQTVSLILSGLEKDGYILRESNTEDRRNKIVKFTEKGKQFADSILEKLETAEIEAFNEMSEEQRNTVIEGFMLLSNALSKSFSK
jgi:DNA-binding MarR family transcriptional regulator